MSHIALLWIDYHFLVYRCLTYLATSVWSASQVGNHTDFTNLPAAVGVIGGAWQRIQSAKFAKVQVSKCEGICVDSTLSMLLHLSKCPDRLKRACCSKYCVKNGRRNNGE